jgi:hypothetical protein
MPSARTVRNIEAVVILAAAIAASIFVPYETLMPGAIGVMAVAVGTALAMAGLAAFLVLVIELAD